MTITLTHCRLPWRVLGAIVLASATFASAANWPQFRGAGASGVDSSQPLPEVWNVKTGAHVRWQTPIPGLSHASPVVWGDRVYIATAVKPGQADLKVGLYGDITSLEEKEPHQWRLLAIEKSGGKVLWNSLAYEGIPRAKRHPKATPCNSTPATDGQHIVALFGSEGLFCFDQAGKLLWKKDLGPMDSGFYLVPTAQWGFASSPIIAEGKVIVLCDVLTKPFLAAYDLTDGNELWRCTRKEVPTWSTPTIVDTRGSKQVVVNGWHFSGGYELGTGKNLWHLDGGGDIPVPTPVFAHGLIYLTSAHGRYAPIRAVRADAVGDITPPDPSQTNAAIAWAYSRGGNYMQTPLVAGGLLFACTDSGTLTCFDAKTGAIKYKERIGTGGQGFTASPVSDGRNVYFTSEQGQVVVLRVAATFSTVATNELHETCLASPAISEGALLFRTRTKLVSVGN